MSEAFVSLATNDDYALGALNLAMSLKRSGTTKAIVIMITNEVSTSMRNALSNVFTHIELVSILDSQDEINLSLLERPDLGITFTKLHCWRLTQFQKAVFMDADTLVLQNIDDLFDRDELSACPDPGWPDCFNSGVFVFRPNLDTYSKLLAFALEHGSFDGGDQGLLNMFFSDWATKDIKRHLPFVYNCVNQFFYSHVPALSHFRSSIKVIHFIGPIKPWHHQYDQYSGRLVLLDGCGHNREYLQKWWSIFVTDTKPLLSTDMACLASVSTDVPVVATNDNDDGGNDGHGDRHGDDNDKGGRCAEIANLDMSTFVIESDEVEAMTSRDHQQAWESGSIDYRGRDKFENIKDHLDSKLDGKKK